MSFHIQGLFLTFVAVFSVWFYYQRKSKELPVRVEGYVDPRFEEVAQVFRKNFESGSETGAALAVYYKGDLIIDLWGGYVNHDGKTPWRRNTMTIAFSTSKGITALLVAKFVDLGYLDYKKPVSHYWPEFAQNGKAGITVEMLLSHQAGLIGFDNPVSMRLLKSDYKKYVSLCEAQKPFWEPGTQFGYHIFTWGYYVDILVMKADPKKRTLDQIFKEEIAEPFGIDFFQGVPTCEQYRVASNHYTQPLWYQLHLLADKEFRSRIMHNLFDSNGFLDIAKIPFADFTVENMKEKFTDYELRQIPMSSFNGYGTARGIAKLYGIISNGGIYEKRTLLTESRIKTLEDIVVQGTDVVIGNSMKFGRGLIILDTPLGNQMFGHIGYGGQLGAGDLQHNVGFAYLTNNLDPFSILDSRFMAVRDTFYKCLKQLSNNKQHGQ